MGLNELLELLEALPAVEFGLLELHGSPKCLLPDSLCVNRHNFAQMADADPAFSPDPEQKSFAKSVMTGVASVLAHVMQDHQVYDLPLSWEGFMWDTRTGVAAIPYEGCLTMLLIEDREGGFRRATGELVLEFDCSSEVYVRFQAEIRGRWQGEVIRFLVAPDKPKILLVASVHAELIEAIETSLSQSKPGEPS